MGLKNGSLCLFTSLNGNKFLFKFISYRFAIVDSSGKFFNLQKATFEVQKITPSPCIAISSLARLSVLGLPPVVG